MLADYIWRCRYSIVKAAFHVSEAGILSEEKEGCAQTLSKDDALWHQDRVLRQIKRHESWRKKFNFKPSSNFFINGCKNRYRIRNRPNPQDLHSFHQQRFHHQSYYWQVIVNVSSPARPIV